MRVWNKAQAKEAQVLARKGDLDRGFEIALHRGQRNVQRNVEPPAPEVIGTPSAVLQLYRHLIIASGQFVAGEEVVGVVGFLGDRLGAFRWKHYKALGRDSRTQINGIKLALYPPLTTGGGKARGGIIGVAVPIYEYQRIGNSADLADGANSPPDMGHAGTIVELDRLAEAEPRADLGDHIHVGIEEKGLDRSRARGQIYHHVQGGLLGPRLAVCTAKAQLN